MMSLTLHSKSRLLALLSAGLLGLAAIPAVHAADAEPAKPVVVPSVVLPAKPSEMLRAPLSDWKPVLDEIAPVLDERTKESATLAGDALIALHIQRTLLAQARLAWADALDAIQQARRLQSTESGRQTAGLLNEILARQALARGDDAWLKQHLRDQVLAMPWADVGPAITQLREQLAAVTAETVENYATRRLDLSAGFTKNRVDVGFAMQVLAMRFQLMEVVPRRDVIVAALDEAIAKRSGEGSR